MLQKRAVHFFSCALFLGLSSFAYGGDQESVVEKVRLLASRPIMDVLQAQAISNEDRTTAYIYKDRVEYYDNALLGEIEKVGKLPATTDKGVLFTEIFLTQFRKHPGLYVVQRGWDKEGNCHVLTSEIHLKTNSVNSLAKESKIEIEAGNSCSGDPCSKCKPYDRDLGCVCEIGTRCNHTVSSD